MKYASNKIAVALSSVFLFSLLPNSALAWWNCPANYKFQLNSSKTKVKCYREAKTYNKPLRKCPKVKVLGVWVGSFYKQDYIRSRGDACTSKDPTGIFTIAVPHSFCPSDYTHVKVKNGRDKCVKTISARETYPNRNVR